MTPETPNPRQPPDQSIGENLDALLRRRGVSSTPAGGPLCGDPEMLASYAESALEGDAREQFQAHLAACGVCRESVARLVRMAPREAVAAAGAPEVSAAWWKRWIWVPALASVIILVGTVVLLRQEPVEQPTQRAENRPVSPPAAAPQPEAPAKPEPAPKKLTLDDKLLDQGKGKQAGAMGGAAGVVGRADAARDAAPTEFAKAPPAVVSEPAAQTLSQVAPQTQQAAPAPPAPQDQRQTPLTLQQQALAYRLQQDAQAKAASGATGDQAAARNAVMLRAPALTKAAGERAGAAAVAETVAVTAEKKEAKAKDAAVPAIRGRLEKGELQLSTDSGATWQVIKTPEEPVAFKFEDASSGAIIGEIRTRSGAIYRTKDAGKTWQKIN